MSIANSTALSAVPDPSVPTATVLTMAGAYAAARARVQVASVADMAIEGKDVTDLSVAPVVGPDDPRRFTDSGIEVQPLYRADDVDDGLEERLGEPGEFPFTRGPH